jgi:predicted ABC-type ATPase
VDKRNPPVLHLLVGVNGAGKTTFYYHQIKPRAKVSFINADEIQKQHWPHETNNPQRSYEAANIAEKQRAEHIKQGKSFAAETVFSHPSKLELIRNAQQSGFMVALYHIHIATPELAKKRVETRKEMGGHDVPEDKIVSRFSRTLTHLQKAVQMADRTMVFDNSELGKSHRHLMTLERGRITNLKRGLPAWAYQQYGREIKTYQGLTAEDCD